MLQMSSEEILKILMLSKNATAIYTGAEIIIQSANDAMIDFWGKDRGVIGQRIEDAVPELKGQPFIDLLRKVWDTGETYHARDMPAVLKVDGAFKTMYFDFEYRAILNAQGETYCILHTATEVTERMTAWAAVEEKEAYGQGLNEELMAINEEYQAQNEELSALNEEYQATNEELNESRNELECSNIKLRQNEERLSQLIQKAPAGIAILTGESFIFELVNENMLDLLGRKPDIIGKSFKETMHEERYTPYLNLLNQVFRSGIASQGNGIKLTKKPGDLAPDRFINYIYQPLLTADGKVNSIMIVATDVTELISARLETQRATEKLALAIEAAGLGTWRIDPDTRQLGYNPSLTKIFGYEGTEPMTYEKAIGQVHPDDRERINTEIDLAIKNKRDYDITYRQHRFDDDSLIWLRSMGKVIEDSETKNRVFAGIVMDITEQKKDEQRKNDFIGMVSHELKTPLTSLGAYVQLLERKANKSGDDFSIGALEKAGIQVKKMTGMINGFLNISRLESGKIQLVKTNFSLDELIEEILYEHRLLFADFEFVFHTCADLMILADRDKISSVLTNLISNAVKYSPVNKTVEITCEAGSTEITVTVSDKGMGIRESHLEKLFDRFYRVEDEQARSITGFGIGLYLTAEILQRHGGRIWAESTLGEGSDFTFSLPLTYTA